MYAFKHRACVGLFLSYRELRPYMIKTLREDAPVSYTHLAAAISWVAATAYRKNVAEKTIGSAEEKARDIRCV